MKEHANSFYQYRKQYRNVTTNESGAIGRGLPFFNEKFILIFTTQKVEAIEEKSNSSAGQNCKDSLKF